MSGAAPYLYNIHMFYCIWFNSRGALLFPGIWKVLRVGFFYCDSSEYAKTRFYSHVAVLSWNIAEYDTL